MDWKELEQYVKQNKNNINTDEWNRVCELHKKNSDLDIDSYLLVHSCELLSKNDVSFSEQELSQIRNKLEEHKCSIDEYERMKKDEKCRDDLKITGKYDNRNIVIWYLKMYTGTEIEYCCLLPKISHKYDNFDALIDDIPSVLETRLPIM